MKVWCPHIKARIEIAKWLYKNQGPFRCVCGRLINQAILVGGESDLVELKGIPSEGERMELQDLPKDNILKAVNEKVTEAQPQKTGGLIITFEQKDGKQFPQKYSKISGKALIDAMTKLNLKDTVELQKNWYHYTLVSFRTGYPRYIPVKRA
jgi:hypothetical protein